MKPPEESLFSGNIRPPIFQRMVSMSDVIDMPTAKYMCFLFFSYKNTKYAGLTDGRCCCLWHYARIIILYLEQTLVLHNVSNIVCCPSQDPSFAVYFVLQ